MDAHRVAFVERFTILLQGVEELNIVLGFIGEVSDGHVQLLPGLLQEIRIKKWEEKEGGEGRRVLPLPLTSNTLDLAATSTLMTARHWGLLTHAVRESNLAILFFQCCSSARGPTSSASLRICSDWVRI